MLLQNDQECELKQSVSANEEVLRQVFENCSDIVFRPIIIDSQNKILFIYIDGLIDTKVVEQVVLKPMMFEGLPSGVKECGFGRRNYTKSANCGFSSKDNF